MTVLALLLSNAIPFFDDLTAIVGALLIAPFTFGLPPLFGLYSFWRKVDPWTWLPRIERAAFYVLLVVCGYYMCVMLAVFVRSRLCCACLPLGTRALRRCVYLARSLEREIVQSTDRTGRPTSLGASNTQDDRHGGHRTRGGQR